MLNAYDETRETGRELRITVYSQLGPARPVYLVYSVPETIIQQRDDAVIVVTGPLEALAPTLWLLLQAIPASSQWYVSTDLAASPLKRAKLKVSRNMASTYLPMLVTTSVSLSSDFESSSWAGDF